jgi:lysophospholipase L1-like esterase
MRVLCALLLLAGFGFAQAPAKAKLKDGVRVAIVGDSITEQRLYSKYIADYLYACYPHLNPQVAQFGWSGERANGFDARIENDLMPFKPDVVTLCYGMNDGSYTAYTPAIGAAYKKPMESIVAKIKASGATAVVGSPGAVDFLFFKGRANLSAETYNANLAQLRDIAKATAAANNFPFANVHDAMIDAMTKAQGKLGAKYHVCGGDGFHPDCNGQLIMAYAFLKALDVDGDLGTITVDFKGESSAVNGHKVLNGSGGKVEVESTRYPFSFDGGSNATNGTRSITPFLPFNADLNRLTLIVKNAPAEKLKVTWGSESQSFTKADLEKGINLADAFAKHPLSIPFQNVDQLVAKQQFAQTMMVKQHITGHRQLMQLFPKNANLEAALAAVRTELWLADATNHAAVKAAVVPVKHTIRVEAE